MQLGRSAMDCLVTNGSVSTHGVVRTECSGNVHEEA
jgi:hypothetical protein